MWGPSQGSESAAGVRLTVYVGDLRGRDSTALRPGSEAEARVRVSVWCPPCGSGRPGGGVGIRYPWKRSRAVVPVGDSSPRQGSVSGLGFAAASQRSKLRLKVGLGIRAKS